MFLAFARNLHANALPTSESIIDPLSGIFDEDLESSSPAGMETDGGPLTSHASTPPIISIVNKGFLDILLGSLECIFFYPLSGDKLLSPPSATSATTSLHVLQIILNGCKYFTCQKRRKKVRWDINL